MDKVLSGDYVMPCRAELMSLQTINKKFDGIKTKTAKLETMRNTSKNLSTSDITGKKIFLWLFAFFDQIQIMIFVNRCQPETLRLSSDK